MIQKTYKYILLFWILSIAAIAGFWYGIVVPQKNKITTTEQTIAGQLEEIDFLKQYAQPSLRGAILQDIESLNAQYTRFVFSEEELVGLEFQIHELGREYKLNNFSNRNAAGRLQTYFPTVTRIQERRYFVKFNADWENFLIFVNRLERLTPVVFVDRLDLKIDHDRQDQANVEVELAILYQPRVFE